MSELEIHAALVERTEQTHADTAPDGHSRQKLCKLCTMYRKFTDRNMQYLSYLRQTL